MLRYWISPVFFPVDAVSSDRSPLNLPTTTMLKTLKTFVLFETDKRVSLPNNNILLDGRELNINIRLTEISRQLGFLRFHTLDDSRDFLEQNFPAIYLYGKNPSDADDRGVKVRIAYSREREDRNRVRAEGEWTCAIVSGQSAT